MSRDGPQFFSESVNTTVSNSTFASVTNGDWHSHTHISHISHSSTSGLDSLLARISKGAFHDAAERGDPPRCHQHTRKVILEEIMEWITSPEPRRQFILWLYGPAGAGKSAIAQSIAEACERELLLAVSFFFARISEGRNDSSRIIANIAYQLSRHIPEIRDHIYNAIDEEPTIFSRSLLTQAKRLVIEPIKTAAESGKLSLKRPVFAVIDGVDECGDGVMQKELLGVLGSIVDQLKHIPNSLIILIASRPEYEIRQAFNEEPLSRLMKSLVLDDRYEPDEDIKKYLESTFQDIKLKHSTETNFPSPWPTDSDISALVAKASGQFIFAATVAKFVDTHRHSPPRRLEIVLGLSNPGKDTPFALLDALYRFILSSVEDLDQVLQVLTLLILSAGGRGSASYLQVDVVEQLLGFEVRIALTDMHALVFVPPSKDTTSTLKIHHASMHDFLMDSSRSGGKLTIDAQKGHVKLTTRWLKMMNTYTTSILSRNHPLVLYVNAFTRHCMESPISPDIANELAVFNLRLLLDKADCHELYPVAWNGFFLAAKRQGGDRLDIFPRLQGQFDDFIQNRLSQYPPMLQACIPALMTMTDPDSYGRGRDIVHLLFHVGRPSASEFKQLRKLDSSLLHIQDLWKLGDSSFANFFSDNRRAGPYHANGTSYAILAKQLIDVLCPSSERKTICEIFSEESRYLYDPGSDPTQRLALIDPRLQYLKEILSKAKMDPLLVNSIQARALQYSHDPVTGDGLKNLALACLDYLDKFAQPYGNHIHDPQKDICIICESPNRSPVVGRTPAFPTHFGSSGSPSLIPEPNIEAPPESEISHHPNVEIQQIQLQPKKPLWKRLLRRRRSKNDSVELP